MAQKSKILRHLNIEQGVSNISNATISDLPVNLFLFVAVFQNGELYMQRIFWTISLAWEIWCYYFRLLFIPLAFRKHEKVCNILNITLVLDLSTKNQIDFKKKNFTKNKIDFKLNSRCPLVRFWNHAYDLRPNCTPLSSTTIMKIPPFDQITFSRYLQRIKPRKARCKIPINYKETIKILTLIFSCYKLAILVKLICKCYINVIFIFRTCNNRWTSVKNAAAGNYLGKVIYQSGVIWFESSSDSRTFCLRRPIRTYHFWCISSPKPEAK